MGALGYKFREEVSIHGVVNTSCSTGTPLIGNYYARFMENEEIVEVRDEPTGEATGQAVIDEELLIEEISIDGMCGVY